jgi:hypothetical protein
VDFECNTEPKDKVLVNVSIVAEPMEDLVTRTSTAVFSNISNTFSLLIFPKVIRSPMVCMPLRLPKAQRLVE